MPGAAVQWIHGAGVELAWIAAGAGEGPAVVVAHGMASDAEAWAGRLGPLAAAHREDGRAIAYDRRGYGASGAPEPYVATTVEEQAEDLAAVISGLGAAPAVVVGEDLGALACLDVLKRHRDLVAGAVLIDPPLLAFVPDAAEELGQERLVLQEALRDGGPAAAIDAYLGPRADPARAARARLRARAFFADFAGVASWPVTRAELRALAVPAAVVTGPATELHVRQAADALTALLPEAARRHDGDPIAALVGLR